MLFGYEWIFDADSESVQQDQHQALLDAGVLSSRIYSDTDGEVDERPGLQACLNATQAGDILVVWQLDRLVDSRAYLVNLLQDFGQRSIGLKVLVGQGAVFDTTHLDLDLTINIIAAVNDLETRILRKRTLNAHAAARERGTKLGPQRKMTASMLQRAMTAMAESEKSMTEIAAELGVTRVTLYTYLNGDGSLKPSGEKLFAEYPPQGNGES